MKRDLSAYLMSWKDSQDKKPVLLRGARQVGKSYLAKEKNAIQLPRANFNPWSGTKY